MDNKDQVIDKIHTDLAGFGSAKNTLKEVNNIDPTITEEDVKI